MLLLSYTVLLLLSFYLLARVCEEYFVDSLDKIAKKLKLSNEAAGATLMAIGSSAPELFIAIIAVFKSGNHEAIGAGTIVGSALFNILVIIGLASIVKEAKIKWQVILRDLIFYAISIALLILAFWDSQINLFEAMVFLSIYIIYVMAVIDWRKILKYKEDSLEILEEGLEKAEKKKWWKVFVKPFDSLMDLVMFDKERYILVFLASIFWIGLLSWILVESAIHISYLLNIPEAIIALTVLAAGTSVPDLVSSLIVAKQGRGEMAITNAVGSNIFDILIGLGLPWTLSLILVNKEIPVDTHNLLSSVILLFATIIVILILLIARKWKLGKWAGYFLITLYLAYLLWAIHLVM